jgi:hypothetical protein
VGPQIEFKAIKMIFVRLPQEIIFRRPEKWAANDVSAFTHPASEKSAFHEPGLLGEQQ